MALGRSTARAQSPTANLPSPDLPRPLEPTGSNLGSLFRDVQQLTAQNRFAYSFLGYRFRTLAEFKQAGRAKILEAFGYRPEKVEPRADVLDRRDLGDHIREKIVFFGERRVLIEPISNTAGTATATPRRMSPT